MSNFWDNDAVVQSSPQSTGNFWENDAVVTPAPTPQYFGSSAGEFAGMQTPETIQDPGQKLLQVPERIGANLPFADRMHAGFNALTGQGTYTQNLADVRAYDAQRRKEDPYGEAAYTAIGMAAFPLGAAGKVAQAPTMANAALRGGVLGAGIGATQGASAVPDYSKFNNADLSNIGHQAAVGAALGTAIPLGASAIGGAYRMAANAINGRVPGYNGPARDLLATAVAQDEPQAVGQTMQQIGPQAMPLDAGASLKGIASGVANARSPQAMAARGNLRGALNTRDAGADQRLVQSLNSNLGPDQIPERAIANLQQQQDALGKTIPTIVKDARDTGVQVDTTDLLSNLGQKITDSKGNPQMLAVLGKARSLLMDNVRNPTTGEVIGTQPVPDPLSLHNTKQYLGNVFKGGDISLGIKGPEVSAPNGAAMQLYGELNNSLRSAVPGYADVNDKFASLKRQEEQVVAGQNGVLNSATKENALHPEIHGENFSALSPEEQAAQRIGTRGTIEATLGTKGNDLSAINSLLQGSNGWNTQRLATQFGQEPVQNVVNTAAGEAAMRGNRNTIQQGTETANRLAMVKALEGASPSAQPPTIPYIPPGGFLRGAGNIPIWGANKAIGAFKNAPNDTQFYNQLGNAITTQGPEGAALMQNFGKVGANRVRNEALAQALRNQIIRGGAVTPNTVGAVYPSKQQ